MLLNLLPENVRRVAKAILAFVATLGTALAVLAADDGVAAMIGAPLAAKLVAVGGAMVAFAAVFGIRNLRTVTEARTDLNRAIARQNSKRVVKKPRKAKARKATRKPRHAVEEADDADDTSPPLD